MHAPALLFALLSLLLVGCEEPPPAQPLPPSPVKIASVSGETATMRRFPARVVASEGSQLAFRVSGQLTELPLRAGQQVEQGQLLARIDDRDFRNQLADAEAQHELAQSQYTRGINLRERGVISASQLEELSARRRQTDAALQQARDNLTYTRMQAPFSGTVARLHVENHEFVQAQSPVLFLQSNDVIDIQFSVSERFISNVRDGGADYQPLVRLEGLPDTTFSATYKEHEASAGEMTQAYVITLTMPSPEGALILPGMSAEVMIDMAQVMRQRLVTMAVPPSAVFTRDDQPGSFVWRYDHDNNVVQLRAVTLGEVTANGVEILEGLSPDDDVVIAGVRALEEGQTVRVLERERGL